MSECSSARGSLHGVGLRLLTGFVAVRRSSSSMPRRSPRTHAILSKTSQSNDHWISWHKSCISFVQQIGCLAETWNDRFTIVFHENHWQAFRTDWLLVNSRLWVVDRATVIARVKRSLQMVELFLLPKYDVDLAEHNEHQVASLRNAISKRTLSRQRFCLSWVSVQCDSCLLRRMAQRQAAEARKNGRSCPSFCKETFCLASACRLNQEFFAALDRTTNASLWMTLDWQPAFKATGGREDVMNRHPRAGVTMTLSK